jgi:hypothetical protein
MARIFSQVRSGPGFKCGKHYELKPWPVTALEGAKRKLREEADKQLPQNNRLVGEFASKFPDRKE